MIRSLCETLRSISRAGEKLTDGIDFIGVFFTAVSISIDVSECYTANGLKKLQRKAAPECGSCPLYSLEGISNIRTAEKKKSEKKKR